MSRVTLCAPGNQRSGCQTPSTNGNTNPRAPRKQIAKTSIRPGIGRREREFGRWEKSNQSAAGHVTNAKAITRWLNTFALIGETRATKYIGSITRVSSAICQLMARHCTRREANPAMPAASRARRLQTSAISRPFFPSVMLQSASCVSILVN